MNFKAIRFTWGLQIWYNRTKFYEMDFIKLKLGFYKWNVGFEVLCLWIMRYCLNILVGYVLLPFTVRDNGLYFLVAYLVLRKKLWSFSRFILKSFTLILRGYQQSNVQPCKQTKSTKTTFLPKVRVMGS